MTDEIERAAARRRAKQARTSAAIVDPAERKASEEAHQLVNALASDESPAGTVLSFAALLVLIAGLLVVELGVSPLHRYAGSFALIFLLVIVDLAASLAAVVAVQRRIAARRRGQLYRIGRGFEPTGYLALLSQKRSSGIVEITLRFARPWPSDRTDSTVDAAREWVPALADARWIDDRTLRLRSVQLRGEFADLTGNLAHQASGHFSNHLLHRHFALVVAAVVPKLEAVTPIEQLDVTILGETLPWDTVVD